MNVHVRYVISLLRLPFYLNRRFRVIFCEHVYLFCFKVYRCLVLFLTRKMYEAESLCERKKISGIKCGMTILLKFSTRPFLILLPSLTTATANDFCFFNYNINLNLNVINTRVANIIPILGIKMLVSLLNKVFTTIMPSIYYEINQWRIHAPESILICFPNCMKNVHFP